MLRIRPISSRYFMGYNRFLCHRNFASASDKKDDIIPPRPPEYQAPKPGRADEYYKLREEQREQEAYRKDIPLGGTRPTEMQKIGLVLTMIYPNKKVIPKVVSSATMRRMRYRLSTLYFFTFMLFILGWLNFTRRFPVYEAHRQSSLGINPYQKQKPFAE